MATTRLGPLGLPAEPYATFEPKSADDRPGQVITRLTCIGLLGPKYSGFVAKQAAAPQPQPEPQPVSGFGGIAARRIIRPPLVVGRVAAYLPHVEGAIRGVHGTAGEFAATLIGLVGNAFGTVGVDGRAEETLAAGVVSVARGSHGVDGNVLSSFARVTGSAAGVIIVGGSAKGEIAAIHATVIGDHDPDEAAIMAYLLAA